MSNSRRSRLARRTRNAIATHVVKMDAQWRSSYVGGQPDYSTHDWNNHVQHHAAQAWKFHTGITKPADILIGRSNSLVKVVEALLSYTHDDADYCPSCGQNYNSTIGKTCCDECGSSCNLQGGCGADCSQGCDAGNHGYSDFACPKCAHLCCWGCSVRCTDDSTGEGHFTCPSCGHNDHYPEIMKEDRAGDHCSQKAGCPHLGKPELGTCTPVITDELIEWAKDRMGRAPSWNCSFYTGNDPV